MPLQSNRDQDLGDDDAQVSPVPPTRRAKASRWLTGAFLVLSLGNVITFASFAFGGHSAIPHAKEFGLAMLILFIIFGGVLIGIISMNRRSGH